MYILKISRNFQLVYRCYGQHMGVGVALFCSNGPWPLTLKATIYIRNANCQIHLTYKTNVKSQMHTQPVICAIAYDKMRLLTILFSFL
jgi:hypothetical protein